MFASFVQESPLLAGIIAAIVAVLVILVLSAVVSSRWSKRETVPVAPAPVRREPAFDGEGIEMRPETVTYTEAEPYRLPLDVDPMRPRHRGRFGFGALTFAFVIGLVAGVGAMTLSSDQFDSSLRSFVALTDALLPRDDDRDTAQPGAAIAAKPASEGSDSAPPLPKPVDLDEPGDVQIRLATFAGKLKQSLPRDAGPELVLTDVEASGMTLNLNYAVGRPVPKAEVAAFDAYVMRAVKSLFCGKESRELRYLNDNGVAFHMAYVDPDGETVAKLTVPADFCA